MRALIVEDEKKVASLIQAGLAEQNIAAEICHNGDDALKRLKEGWFDAAVLDIMVPGRDGLSILREVRSLGNQIPILLLTARGDVSEKVQGLNLGADDYLAKPFAMAELVARLRAIFRRRSGQGLTALTVGDVSLNLGTREVKRGSKTIALTPREFSLLECLLRTPDRIVTRTQLSQQVWGYQFDPGTNVVEVCVQRLRRKIDDGTERPLIQTVRGTGYIIKTP